MRYNICFKMLLLLLVLSLSYNSIADEQTTDTILMVSPDSFRFKDQAAVMTKFEKSISKTSKYSLMNEFTRMVLKLESHGIKVLTLKSLASSQTADAVFSNYWFSSHKLQDNKTMLVLYPVFNRNRRVERKNLNELKLILRQYGIDSNNVVDLSYYESAGKAMEGTGSMVLDREHKVAFVSLSPRADLEAVKEITSKLGYKLVTFISFDKDNHQIYHTNMVISIGNKFVVLCDECIQDKNERSKILLELEALGKNIISITPDQVRNMSGNIIQVRNTEGEFKIVMSDTAYNGLTSKQISKLSQYGEIVNVQIPIIEIVGGGSARCMMTEIFY